MLLMLLIGWIVLLPAVVVAGLYIGSTILGRRRATLNVYENLLADEGSLDHEVPAVTPEAITGRTTSVLDHPTASPDAPASDVSRVSAGY